MLQEDERVWMKRPMEAYLLDCACRSVNYLPELHTVMLQALLAEFVQAVDIYLGAMRDLKDDESLAVRIGSQYRMRAFL